MLLFLPGKTPAHAADAKMTVEFKSSTVTNMDMDNSKIGYKQFFAEDGMVRYSVHALRNSPFRVATVCLGLLCVLLLFGVLGQSLHYQKVEHDHQTNLKSMNMEKETLQEDLKIMQKQKNDHEFNRKQLQSSYDVLSRRKEQIQMNNYLLTEETNTLKQSQSELQTKYDALSKELEKLNGSTNELQSFSESLSTAKHALETQYNSLVQRKNNLQASYNSAIKERDNLQNKFNNVTRSKELMQKSYNEMIKNVEHLQDRYNFTSSEKDKIQSSHQNLTIEKNTLQESYNLLVKARDELQDTYASLVEEKKGLTSSLQNVTTERDLLKVTNDNLTAERDQLRVEVERMNATIHEKKCPTGWHKFEYSCYYTSIGKKSWNMSREYCQSKRADLAVIKSREEMVFINGLYGSDKEAWIGLTDGGAEGQWKWVDGTPMTTSFWGKGQPNSYDGRNQDCVEFWHRAAGIGDWNDENCRIEQNWICEM